MSSDRELDVVVYGATGFVGRLTAAHLAAHAPDDVRIGLAGRSQGRLEEARDELGDRAAQWPLIAADAQDPEAMEGLARRSRVVATTVGPYRKYGGALVAACAQTGTHYADLAGEILFMREVIDEHHDTAARTGARLVHTCGFDSIPSDLGVLLAHRAADADGAGDLEDTTLVVTALRGGVSGGTIDSLRSELDGMRGDKSLARIAADPYSLSPDREAEPDLGDEGELRGIERLDELGLWAAPFAMAMINTRVVRRSNSLQEWDYGRRFRYREVMSVGGGPLAPVKGAAVAGALAALAGGLSFGPTRPLLDRLLPDPGEGPDEDARRKGFFRIEVHARTSSGRRYRTRVEAQGDPGYAATAVMFGESALCLALGGERMPDRAGVLTPATAMGPALVERLRAVGHTYEAGPA